MREREFDKKRFIGTVLWCIGLIVSLPVSVVVLDLVFPIAKNTLWEGGLMVGVGLFWLLWAVLVIATILVVLEDIDVVATIREYFSRPVAKTDDPKQTDWR